MIQTGSRQGRISLDHSLANLAKKGVVTREAAAERAYNMAEFNSLMEQS
jgi:Tfp pilus assembly pilus retraction ATPase PilT